MLTWLFLGMCSLTEGGRERERERERECFLVTLLVRMLIVLDQGPTLMTSLDLNDFLTPNTPPWGYDYNMRILRGAQTFSP